MARRTSKLSPKQLDRLLLVGEDGVVLDSLGTQALPVTPRDVPSAPRGARTLLAAKAILSPETTNTVVSQVPMVREGPWEGATEDTKEDKALSLETRAMSAVAQAAAVLDSSLEAEAVLARAVEYACLLFDVPSAAVLLPAPTGSYFVGAQAGLPDTINEKGMSYKAVKELGFDVPVPLFIPDLSSLRTIPYFDELCEQGIAGALSVPLATDTSLEGILLLQDRLPSKKNRF